MRLKYSINKEILILFLLLSNVTIMSQNEIKATNDYKILDEIAFNKKVIIVLDSLFLDCNVCDKALSELVNYINKEIDIHLLKNIIGLVDRGCQRINKTKNFVSRWKNANNINFEINAKYYFSNLSFYKHSCIVLKQDEIYKCYSFPYSKNHISQIELLIKKILKE